VVHEGDFFGNNDGSQRGGFFGFGGGQNVPRQEAKVRIDMLNDQVKFFPDSIKKLAEKLEQEANSIKEIQNDLQKVTSALQYIEKEEEEKQ